jgi:hypothetical protein
MTRTMLMMAALLLTTPVLAQEPPTTIKPGAHKIASYHKLIHAWGDVLRTTPGSSAVFDPDRAIFPASNMCVRGRAAAMNSVRIAS